MENRDKYARNYCPQQTILWYSSRRPCASFSPWTVMVYLLVDFTSTCVISGLRHEVDCTLPGHYAASSGNFLRTFRDNLLVPSLSVSLEYGTNRFSRNVGKKITTTHCVMTRKSAVLFSSLLFSSLLFSSTVYDSCELVALAALCLHPLGKKAGWTPELR